MRAADRTAGALLLALAVAFSVGALKQYAYWGPTGPGPAFLPFWLGLVMALLALLLLAGTWRTGDVSGDDWLPRGDGLRRLALVIGLTVAYVALLNVTGMAIGVALFMAAMMRGLDRLRWRLTLPVALATAAAIHLVFGRWLRVPLPEGLLGL